MAKFSPAPVAETSLDSAHLAKVLTQVQFSRTTQLVTDAAEEALAEALGRYPVRRRAAGSPTLMINGHPPSTVLTFADTAATWQAAISDTSVSLETRAYESRADFCDRATEVLSAIAAVAVPPIVDRVGLRYINRFTGDALGMIPDYVIPQLRALQGNVDTPLRLRHSVTDSIIEISEAEALQARTGILPPGASFDPALAPLDEPSWVLDMDMFSNRGGFPFDPLELNGRLSSYAETIYAFFRFATTERFQAEFARDHASTKAEA